MVIRQGTRVVALAVGMEQFLIKRYYFHEEAMNGDPAKLERALVSIKNA